jgi:hypothetical protein
MSVPAQEAPAAPESGANAPSTGQAGASPARGERADPTQVSHSEGREQDKRGPDYIRQAFMAMRGVTQAATPPAGEAAPQAPPASPPPAEPERSGTRSSAPATTLPAQRQGTPSTPQQAPQADRITLTPDELARRVQAEADRKLAKQQADDAARREREREVELRRNNPFEYARLMEERETQLQESQKETERLTGLLTSQLTQYDRNILDPIVIALPEHLRKQVISPEEGIAGRRKTAEAAVKALRQHLKGEALEQAKADLRKDQAFIKEVLARYGGESQEPESVQARPPSSPVPVGESGMNGWIRAAGKARSTSG